MSFLACHDVLDPDPFYKNCVYDVCACLATGASLANPNPGDCVCPVISHYAQECAEQGVELAGWRDKITECGETT